MQAGATAYTCCACKKTRGHKRRCLIKKLAQISYFFQTWSAIKFLNSTHRKFVTLQHGQSRRRSVRAFLNTWALKHVVDRTLMTRKLQANARFFRRILIAFFYLWRSTCDSSQVSWIAFTCLNLLFSQLNI